MDYLEYFNLFSEPFSHAPLPRFYYASARHSDALRRLTHAVSSMRGLALLVGDIGRGKTTLARRLLDSLPEAEYEAAMLVIVHTGITPNWMLKRIAMQLGVAQPAADKLSILSQLYQRLVEIHREGRKAVVLIDEAQMLQSREVMEEFRGLLNLEVPGHKLISFVFFGLPEIDANLALDPPLAQRIALRCRLKSLDVEDTANYVRHRMRLAGCEEEIFTDESLQEVHRWSSGVPRVINSLCDNILLELFFAQERQASAEVVAEVADNLSLVSHAADARAMAAPSLPVGEEVLAHAGAPGEDAMAVVERGAEAAPAPSPAVAPKSEPAAEEAPGDVPQDPEAPEEDDGMLSPDAIAAQVAGEPGELGDDGEVDALSDELLAADDEADDLAGDMHIPDEEAASTDDALDALGGDEPEEELALDDLALSAQAQDDDDEDVDIDVDMDDDEDEDDSFDLEVEADSLLSPSTVSTEDASADAEDDLGDIEVDTAASEEPADIEDPLDFLDDDEPEAPAAAAKETKKSSIDLDEIDDLLADI